MNQNVATLGAMLVLTASNVFAADPTAAEAMKEPDLQVDGKKEGEKESPWTTTAGLGYINASGNTNTKSLAFRFDTAYEVVRWKHELHLGSLNASADGETTADRKILFYQSSFKFRPRDYFYGSFNYEDDRFTGFDYQAIVSVGYGRKLIDIEKHKLKAEIGPGYRQYQVIDAPDSESEALLRLLGVYNWKISKYSEFIQDLVFNFGEEQDEWRSITELKTSITDTLALRIAYNVHYLKEVPPENVSYDRTTTILLDYTF
jgi:putative salt-induced outer membrane protein